MSTQFQAYILPRRDLWDAVDVLRAYLAADHEYAYLTQVVAINEYHLRGQGDTRRHATKCATNSLGSCDCDYFQNMKRVFDWMTDKDPELNGIEAVFYELEPAWYIMRFTGVAWWFELPTALVNHLNLHSVYYNDGTDIPDDERDNARYVDLCEKLRKAGHYFVVPLLTRHDLWSLSWSMIRALPRRIPNANT